MAVATRAKAFVERGAMARRKRAPFLFLEREMNEKRAEKRRKFLKQAGATGAMSLGPAAVRSVAWAAGSDSPGKKERKIRVIPLTDCFSVVMASGMRVSKKHG